MAKFPFQLSRRWIWFLRSIAATILIVVALSYFIRSEYLRRFVEREMNRHLKEYTVHVGRAYFHPLTFSLDVEDLTLIQTANPAPRWPILSDSMRAFTGGSS